MRVLSSISSQQVLPVLKGMFEWWQEGLGLLLPSSWRRQGWRQVAEVRLLDKDLHPLEHRTLEASWVNDRRLVSSEDKEAKSAPCVLYSLPGNLIYRTRISLPDSARRRLRETVRLRLSELSPLSPEEIMFDGRAGDPSGEGRFWAEIAIARKTDIARVVTRTDAASQKQDIGHYTEDGKVFAFETKRASSSGSQDWRLRLTLCGVLLCLIGLPLFLDRQQAALETHRAHLIADTKELITSANNLDVMQTVIAQHPSIPSGQLPEMLSVAEKDLPADTMIETLTVTGSLVTATGYLPDDPVTTAQGTAYPYQLLASNRPGVQKFSLQRETGGTP